MNLPLSQKLKEASHPRGRAEVLQQALDAAANTGGILEIPPGEWVITTLMLRGNMTLRLARGCVLKAHDNLDDYPTAPSGHNKDRQPFHLLWATDCENLTIEGDGVIDGNGMAFWDEPLPVLKARGVDISTIDVPSYFPKDGPPFWRAKKRRVSPLIEIHKCRNIVLRDFTIHESPGWTVHFFLCDKIRVDGITIDNHDYGPNNDGLDINGCRDMIISNCNIRGCDDNIIIKSTADARVSERITVTNCILKSLCAGVGLGAETVHGIRNITFSNCVCDGVQRALQIEMWDPGFIENVALTNITGSTLVGDALERPIYLDIQQHRRPDPALGTLRNVVISNLAMTTRGRMMMTAQDGGRMEDITIRDVQLTYPEILDWSVLGPGNSSTQNSNYSPESRGINSVLVADNIDGLTVSNLCARMPSAGNGTPKMHGIWCRKVKRGYVDCPRLASNDPGHETVFLRDSEVEIRAAGKPGR